MTLWQELRQRWQGSAWFQVALVAAGGYAGVRLLVHFVSLGLLLPDDLRIYLLAAERLLNQEQLYRVSELATASSFQYAPLFALALEPVLWLPDRVVAIGASLLHLPIYAALLWRWEVIFRRYRLVEAQRLLWAVLPLGLVYMVFWSDLTFLNVYLLMPLLATLLLEALLEGRFVSALGWVSLILPIKPFWAFPVLLLVFNQRWAFLSKLSGGALLIYGAGVLATCGVAGVAYGAQQYLAYFEFLTGMSGAFAWRTLSASLPLGYNHSVLQTVVYFLGVSPVARGLALTLKVGLLLPLAGLALRDGRAGEALPPRRLILWAFGLYLAMLIGLDVLWEVALGIILFAYLWPAAGRGERMILIAGFVPVALLDVWRLLSLLIGGVSLMSERGDVLTDPAAYAPLILVQLVMFYALVVRRLSAGVEDETATEAIG